MNAISFTKGAAAKIFAAVALFSLIAGMIPMQAFAAVDVFTDSFEQPTNLGLWTAGNAWASANSGHISPKSATVNGGNNGQTMSKTISTVGYENLSVSFWYKAVSLESSEGSFDKVEVEYTLNGSTWVEFNQIDDSDDPEGNENDMPWLSASFNLPAGANNNASFALRFKGTLGSGNDKVLVDDVTISGTAIPVDLCSNITDVQATVPQGYYAEGGQCFPNPVDVCPNDAGVQTDPAQCTPDPVACTAPYTGFEPNCVPPPCESGTSGTYPNCVPDPVACTAPYTGFQPNCVPPPCEQGQTGTYPNCVTPPPPSCTDGLLNQDETDIDEGGVCTPPPTPCEAPYTGNVPNCVPPPCESGTSGTYPNCVPDPVACTAPYTGFQPNCVPPPCEQGQTGTYPNCVNPVVDVCSNIAEVQTEVPAGYHLEGESTCVENGGGPDPIYGCTDKEANNYDPEATSDDKSCTYGYLSQCHVEAQNLLVNPSFEDSVGLTSGNWGIFTSVNGWAYSLSSGIEIWNNLFIDPTGEQNVELDGEDATKITQTVNGLIPGATYELSFDFAARDSNAADNHIEAMADGVSLVNQSTSNTSWLKYGATFTSDGSTDISFVDLGTVQEGPGGTGTLLDNAKLCLVRTPVDDDETLYRIQGYTWHDDNRNAEWDGTQDEEEGNEEGRLDGFTIRITNNDGDSRETTTDENGFYYFDVPAGTWVVTEVEEGQWFRTTQESFTVTVPALPPVEEVTFLDSIMNLIIPVAYAQAMIDTYGDYNFGNDERRGGGGGGGNNNDDEPDGEVLGDSDDADDTEEDTPEGEVLGEQVDAVPAGAPDAGAGGTSRGLEFFQIAPVAMMGRTRKHG